MSKGWVELATLGYCQKRLLPDTLDHYTTEPISWLKIGSISWWTSEVYGYNRVVYFLDVFWMICWVPKPTKTSISALSLGWVWNTSTRDYHQYVAHVLYCQLPWSPSPSVLTYDQTHGSMHTRKARKDGCAKKTPKVNKKNEDCPVKKAHVTMQ